MATKRRLPQTRVSLWGRRKNILQDALALGVADEASTSVESVLKDADLVVLATPVGVMPDLIRAIIPFIKESRPLVTDVGSVKGIVHKTVGHPLTQENIPFIGSHPMAGSEKQGLRAASTFLFQKAPLVITNDENIPTALVLKLEHFWETVGCRCFRYSASEHDTLIARVSHLPHTLASLCIDTAIPLDKERELGKLAGNGLRDTTRVASGDPAMWTEILMENKEALLPLLQQMQQSLSHLESILSSTDTQHATDALHTFLKIAKIKRDTTLESPTPLYPSPKIPSDSKN